MAKFLSIIKLIFSRLFFVAISVIAQVVIVSYYIFNLTESYVYFQLISSIIGLIVFVLIVNDKVPPEQKMLWSFLIIAFPIVGIVIYIVLKAEEPMAKRTRRYAKLPSLPLENVKEQEKIYEIANKYAGQIKYLETMSSFRAYRNTKVAFLKDGKEFYESLMKDLENASKYIFLEYFIINHGHMWNSILNVLKEKVKEGVEVKLIYDDVGCVKYLRGSYYKYLRKLGIECYKFNTMLPFVSAYHNNRDHRKIAIIDGKIAYTGGINISDEYMNLVQIYGHWKDNAVRLTGQGINNLIILFLQNFSIVSLKQQNYEKYLYDESLNDILNDEIVMPYGTGPRSRYYENFATDAFLNLINQASKNIDISTPYLIIDYAISNALIAAVARGVKVRLLIPATPDKALVYAFTKSAAYELAINGVEIYKFTPGFNHAKTFLIDDEVAYVGTTNLDFRSLLHHYECGVWIYNSDCILDIKKDFDDDFAKSKLVPPKELKYNFFMRLLISFLKIFQSLL